MNWHEIIDERALDMDRVVARVLREEPGKLELATAWIQRFLAKPDYSEQNKDCLREWMGIIRQGLPRVLEALGDSSDEGRRLRQSSPFSILMPQAERLRILAKYESRRTRTHSAGV